MFKAYFQRRRDKRAKLESRARALKLIDLLDDFQQTHGYAPKKVYGSYRLRRDLVAWSVDERRHVNAVALDNGEQGIEVMDTVLIPSKNLVSDGFAIYVVD